MTFLWPHTALHFFILWAFLWKVSSDVVPPKLNVVEGASLYLYWQAESGPLQSCSVSTPWDENVTLDPSSGSGRVSYFGAGLKQGVCGVKADNVKLGVDNGTWILTAIGKTTSQRKSNITVYGAVTEGVKRNLTVEIDQYLMVHCGPEDDVPYCEITSPYNETTVIRLSKCQLELKRVEYHHAGTWTCRYLLQFQTFQAHATTVLNVITNTVNFVVGKNETEKELNIFCSHPVKPILLMAYCSILPPNGAERIMLAPGRGLSRYRYFGFAPYHCGVSIAKPLQPEEYGPWLCEMVYNSKDHRGGYVYVENNKTKVPAIEVKAQSNVKVVLSNKDPLAVKCSVPRSLVYCWLQHPNGTVFSPAPGQSYDGYKYYGLGYDFGECGISVSSPSVIDSGAWICGMGLKNDHAVDQMEITTTVQVLVSDFPLAPNTPTTAARKGMAVTVGCGMVHPQAVSYCRFWKPDKNGLTIDSNTNTSLDALVKYHYAGEGLYVGDCSLLISSVQDNDLGTWICATKPTAVKRGVELTTKFEIVEDKGAGMSAAAGFGILIAMLIMGIGTTVFYIYKNSRRAKLRASDETLLSCSAAGEMEVEISSITSPTTQSTDPTVRIAKKSVLFQRHIH